MSQGKQLCPVCQPAYVVVHPTDIVSYLGKAIIVTSCPGLARIQNAWSATPLVILGWDVALCRQVY